MEALTSADSCTNSCDNIDDSIAFESPAITARRKRMEIIRIKQIVSASADVFLSVNNKRSRFFGAPCYSQYDGEQMHSLLHEPLSEDELLIPPQLLVDKAGKEIIESPSLSSEHVVGLSYRRLIRSVTFPPGVGGRPSTKRTVKFGMTDMYNTAQGKGGDPFNLAHVKGGSNKEDAYLGPSTTWDAEVISISSPSLLKSVAQCEKHGEEQDNEIKMDDNSPDTTFAPNSTMAENCLNLPPLYPARLSVMNGWCPPHGKLSVLGQRREMEDAVVMVPNFVVIPFGAGEGCCNGLTGSRCTVALHFFGVYDGHGGAQASTYCKKRFHHALAEEILSVAEEGDSGGDDKPALWWTGVMDACFLKIDKEVGGVCPNGLCSDFTGSSTCCTDTIAPGTAGSTAVVAVLSPQQIIVGNCGDSRAVVSCAGKAIALSRDHKPELEDERKRIEAAGGRVVNWDGYRVGGLLAMSRAIGDRYLKPYVIAKPEVTIYERTQEDQCLILASDGLWDAISNDVACEVARRCLASFRRKYEAGYMSSKAGDTPTTAVAALLTKLAVARGSKDNISVIVIDLKFKH